VILDPVNFTEQAALFKGNRVERIPPLTGEYTGRIIKLTDSGIALVESLDTTTFAATYYLYKNSKITPLDLGPGQIAFSDVNNQGLVSGILFGSGTGNDRAFRFDPRTNRMTILNPLVTEPDSWDLAINSNGEVLGYSFVPGGLERIGVWGKSGEFSTYFVEGTPEIPTVSSRLLWNERGLIVITFTSRNDQSSYIVPGPGLRIDLADITDGLPPWNIIDDVNARGDLLGSGGDQYFNAEHTFILERVPGPLSPTPPVVSDVHERDQSGAERTLPTETLRRLGVLPCATEDDLKGVKTSRLLQCLNDGA
jgi:hypothetical protein